MPRTFRAVAGLAAAILLSPVAHAQPQTIVYSQPTLDRWMYPFNSAFPLGSELEARLFSPLGSTFENDFDDRDGQLLVGFETAPAIPAGQGVGRYRIGAARLIVTTSRDLTFRYDPTYDSYRTYLAATDAEFVADADAGRPLELFGVGYRGGFTLATYQESSPHGGAPFPNKRVRNAYAADFDAQGAAFDVSNNVTDRFEVRPWAVGQAALPAGALVPIDTEFTFEIDLTNAAAVAYLRRGLDAGRVNLMVTSLAITTQESSAVPAVYMKEFPTEIGGRPARLEIEVCVGRASDFNCDGQVNTADITAFLSAWFADRAAGSVGASDFNADGQVNTADITAFLSQWFADRAG